MKWILRYHLKLLTLARAPLQEERSLWQFLRARFSHIRVFKILPETLCAATNASRSSFGGKIMFVPYGHSPALYGHLASMLEAFHYLI